jgi:succinate dehydrogenase cytochrome b556 subunit
MTALRAAVDGSIRYRGREGQWAYLLNRISGLATLLFLTIHILDTATVFFAPSVYEHAVTEYYRNTPFVIGEIMLVAAVLYHGLNGYKIIYFDLKPERWNERNEARWFWGVCSAAFLLWLPAAYLMGRSLYLHNICRCPPAAKPTPELPVWAEIGVVAVLAAAVLVLGLILARATPLTGVRRDFEAWMWLFMRWSGVLLLPLVWIHVLINDVLFGVHAIDLNYVAVRWAALGWRAYAVTLLAFTFAHGMNGLRTVLGDYVRSRSLLRKINVGLLLAWIVWTAVGAVAIVGGVRTP